MLINAIIEGLFSDVNNFADFVLCRCTECGKLMRVFLDDDAARFINSETAFELKCAECVDGDAESKIVYFTEIETEDSDENSIDETATNN